MVWVRTPGSCEFLQSRDFFFIQNIFPENRKTRDRAILPLYFPGPGPQTPPLTCRREKVTRAPSKIVQIRTLVRTRDGHLTRPDQVTRPMHLACPDLQTGPGYPVCRWACRQGTPPGQYYSGPFTGSFWQSGDPDIFTRGNCVHAREK